MSEFVRVRANGSHLDDDCCAHCGYPFDRHEECLAVGYEGGPLVCSESCGRCVLDPAPMFSSGCQDPWFPPAGS